MTKKLLQTPTQLLSAFFFIITTVVMGQTNAWINEIHYDNNGDDLAETVEVVVENPES